MTKRLLTIAIMIFAFTAISYSQTVDDIIGKSMQAAGGEAKFSTVKTMKMTGSMDMMGMNMPFTIYNKKPAFRMEQEVMGQKMISAYNGKTGWMISPMSGSTEPQEIPEEMLNSVKQQANFGQNPITSMKENGITATLIGKEKADGVDAYKIKMVGKDNSESFLFIDASKYLPIKMTNQAEVMGQKKDIEMFFKDYKSFDGITMATAIEMKTEGQVITIKFEKVEANIPVDDALFEMPKKQ